MRAFEKVTDLAYGENPHQRAAYYSQVGARMHVLSMVQQVAGKDLSFNNVLDLNSGRLLVEEFERPGLRDHQAQQPVRRGDRQRGRRGVRARVRVRSAVGLRRRRLPQPAGRRPARRAASPASSARSSSPRSFTDEALELLERKPNMRILEDNERRRFDIAERDLKRVMGGLLVQDRDIDLEDRTAMEVVTERKPSEAEWGEMLFGWKVCKHVRSNAIVLVARARVGRHRRGPDEPRRLRPARDREGARRRGVDLPGAALASDAFFPFADGPQLRRRGGRHVDHPARRIQARPRRSSRPPTPPGSAWSSRTAATSSTDARRARVVAPEARQQRAQQRRCRRRTRRRPPTIENGTLVNDGDGAAARRARASARSSRRAARSPPAARASRSGIVWFQIVCAEDPRGHVGGARRGEREQARAASASASPKTTIATP